MTGKIERLAAALAEAWRTDTTVPLPDGADAPSSRAEAYAIQDRMAELIGEPRAGWKVGATVKAVQKLEGHDGPIPGRLFAPHVYDTPARVPGSRYGRCKVETEFAFRFTRDLPMEGAPFAAADIADSLVFHLAIELAGPRFAAEPGGRQHGSYDTIADNGNGAGFVFGPAIADWRDIPFETLPIEARIDGGAAIEVYTGEYRRDPLIVVAETANDLAARGVAFVSGDYISTGSLTLPTPIQAGQTLVAIFADLGTLELKVT